MIKWSGQFKYTFILVSCLLLNFHHTSTIDAQTTFTVEDEVTMWELIQESEKRNEIELFLKMFPYSPQKRELEKRLKVIENREFAERKSKSQEGKQLGIGATNEENDGLWAKLEFGSPIMLKLKDENGKKIETKDRPIGLYVGWAHEVGSEIGLGAGVHYFKVKPAEGGGAFNHLFFELNVKGKAFDFLNYGVSYGHGRTHYQCDDCGNRKTDPGFNALQSASIGFSGSHFGMNLIYATFVGSSNWEYGSKIEQAQGEDELKWKGEMVGLTLEVIF